MIKGKKTVAVMMMALLCGLSFTGCQSDSNKANDSSISPSIPTVTVSPSDSNPVTDSTPQATEPSKTTADSSKSTEPDVSASTTPDSDTESNTSKSSKSPYSMEGTYLGSYSSTDQTTILAYINGKKLILYTTDFKKFQEFTINTDMSEKEFEENAAGNFIFTDANFDSYSDLGILSSIDGDNKTYNFFLWDDEQEKYVYNEELSQIVTPVLVDNQHVINSHVEKNSTDFTDYKYEWNDNELITIEKTTVTYNEDTNKYKITIKKYDENGKLTSSTSKTSDNPY